MCLKQHQVLELLLVGLRALCITSHFVYTPAPNYGLLFYLILPYSRNELFLDNSVNIHFIIFYHVVVKK